jgi:hypothetical protein
MRELKKLIALRDFSLGIAERHRWKIGNDRKFPGHVLKGTMFAVGSSEEEQRDAHYLVYCKAVGDAGDEELVKRVQEEIKAESNPAVQKLVETICGIAGEHLQEARKAKAELDNMAGRLRKSEDALVKAQASAELTLKKALAKRSRLELPGIKPRTRALIKEAVSMYMTRTDKHSLRRIAEEFKVKPQRVSQWFKMFTKATGVAVVTNRK